jgi:hypothetical protein
MAAVIQNSQGKVKKMIRNGRVFSGKQFKFSNIFRSVMKITMPIFVRTQNPTR